MLRKFLSTRQWAVSGLALSLGILAATAAWYVAAPLQDNPVFTTPTMAEIELGKKDGFAKDLVTGASDGQSLGTIDFSGNHYFHNYPVEQQISRLKDKGDGLLAPGQLEKSLAMLNKQNTFKLKATVSPNAQTGKSDIHLDVYERQPLQLTTTFDNQGRPRIGTYRGAIQLTNESFFGYGDKLQLQYMGAEDTNYLQGSYDVPINRRGGTVGMLGEFTHVDVNLMPVDRIGQHYAVGLRWVQPWDQKREWTTDLGVMARHINLNGVHADPRFVFAGLKWNHPDKLGSTMAYAQTFLGNNEWFGGDSRFWRVRGTLNRTFNLPWENQKLVLKAQGQYTPDALIPVQMFPLAGEYGVRGYSEGFLYGDSGYTVTAEHHWPVPFLKRINPDLNARVRGVTFVDAGQGFLRGTRHKAVGDTFLLSAGLGLRARLYQQFQGFVDFAWRIGSNDNFAWQNLGTGSTDPSFRIHFGIRSDWMDKSYKKRG